MKRSTRREIAKDTLKSLKQGYYLNGQGKTIGLKSKHKFSTQNTEFFLGDDLDNLLEELNDEKAFKTAYEVTGESTLAAILRLQAEHENLLTLNFASAKNPGGGFLNGSQAQEESLARSSGLYPCLLNAEKYYMLHRKIKSPFYTDNMIYSPMVPVFKNDEGKYLDELAFTSFITSPAVNAGVVRRQQPEHEGKIEGAMKTRIKKVLALSKSKGHSILILGAWGCGVFENEPEMIARLFHEVLETKFSGTFEKVVFAIYSKDEKYSEPFKSLFLS
ncbi:MAG: TIGR02452 family protein [Bacteroidetes bacterium]|nr:MAG: TIGR02452 family protein [Bacteroidota bacterium]